ncbi:ABC transporter permease [Ornithinimicrobium sp. Y1694]|uniref:ABC transporter permease n=1 Tax=Ornithinimicrobium sp. Y1694 TaxID=3418590 RepID=UPI003CE8DBDE
MSVPPTITQTGASPPLLPLGRRPRLQTYIAQLWQRRHFIYADSRTRAFSGNRDMLLGNAWLIGVPLLQGLVYFIIFGLILKTNRGIANFPGFLIIGIFMFRYTTACLNQGVGAMAASRGLTMAFSFPRAAIPLSVIVRQTLSMGPVLATMALLLLTIPPGTRVTATWLLFPIIFTLQTLFNTGLVLYVARLGSAVPDFRHIMSFLARFWFYTSGVFFSIERFVTDGIWQAVFQGNPMYLVLDMSRDLLLYDTVPEARSWILLGLWALSTPLIAFWYFWKGEETYGRL